MSSAVSPVMKLDYVVSVCAVVQNDAGLLRSVVPDCIELLKTHFRYFELVLIDNASTDGTSRTVQELAAAVPGMRVLRLSRRVRLDVAITAALDHVIGDFVIVLDLHSDPLRVIPDVVKQLAGGADVVVGRYRDYRGSAMRRRLSRLSRRIAAAMLNICIEPNTGSLLGFSRRAVNSLTRIRSKSRFILYDSAAVGFEQQFYDYQQQPRPEWPARSEPVWYAIAARLQMVVAHSLLPLRLASALGLLASFLNLVYLLYILAVVVLKRNIAEGWLTTSVTHTSMFLILFLILAVMTEYIGRILEESKDYPVYFVQQELASTVSTYDQQRINVISDGD